MKLTDRLKAIEDSTSDLESKYKDLVDLAWESMRDGHIDEGEKLALKKKATEFVSELSSVIMVVVALVTQDTTSGAIAGVLSWGTLWVILQGPLSRSGIKSTLLQERDERSKERKIWLEKEEAYKERLRQLEFDNWKLTNEKKRGERGE